MKNLIFGLVSFAVILIGVSGCIPGDESDSLSFVPSLEDFSVTGTDGQTVSSTAGSPVALSSEQNNGNFSINASTNAGTKKWRMYIHISADPALSSEDVEVVAASCNAGYVPEWCGAGVNQVCEVKSSRFDCASSKLYSEDYGDYFSSAGRPASAYFILSACSYLQIDSTGRLVEDCNSAAVPVTLE